MTKKVNDCSVAFVGSQYVLKLFDNRGNVVGEFYFSERSIENLFFEIGERMLLDVDVLYDIVRYARNVKLTINREWE